MFTVCTKVFMGLLVIRETARGSGRVRVFLVLPFPAHVGQWSHCCLCKPGLFLRSQATWLRGSQRPDAGRQGSVWDWVLTSVGRQRVQTQGRGYLVQPQQEESQVGNLQLPRHLPGAQVGTEHSKMLFLKPMGELGPLLSDVWETFVGVF